VVPATFRDALEDGAAVPSFDDATTAFFEQAAPIRDLVATPEGDAMCEELLVRMVYLIRATRRSTTGRTPPRRLAAHHETPGAPSAGGLLHARGYARTRPSVF